MLSKLTLAASALHFTVPPKPKAKDQWAAVQKFVADHPDSASLMNLSSARYYILTVRAEDPHAQAQALVHDLEQAGYAFFTDLPTSPTTNPLDRRSQAWGALLSADPLGGSLARVKFTDEAAILTMDTTAKSSDLNFFVNDEIVGKAKLSKKDFLIKMQDAFPGVLPALWRPDYLRKEMGGAFKE